MKKIFLIPVLIGTLNLHSQLVGTDTALLINLVTTTASQLNELEKLVTNTEKFSQRMRQYNELAQDQYFRAERVMYVAQEVAAKKEVKDLGSLNSAIRSLKYSMEDMQSLLKQYGDIEDKEVRTKQEVKIETSLNEKKQRVAGSQVEKSASANSAARANQLTAQNTALLYESNVSMHNTELQILENTATTNRLLAEMMAEKRKEQLEKAKHYQAGEKR